MAGVKEDIDRQAEDLIKWAGYADSGNGYYFESALKDFNGIATSRRWNLLTEVYYKALDELKIDSATEGLGCKYNRVLQATEGYFTDKKIIEGLDEI
jgi:hypothetical protein